MRKQTGKKSTILDLKTLLIDTHIEDKSPKPCAKYLYL